MNHSALGSTENEVEWAYIIAEFSNSARSNSFQLPGLPFHNGLFQNKIKHQTGGRGLRTEFPRVLKKEPVEITGVN